MVSLNAIMVDGTGMCGSCRVTVGGEIKFACVDGPDFDGHEVDFKELMRARSASRARSGGQHRLRARLPGREAAVRRGQAQLQEVQGPAAARGEDARARPARALAQLQGSEPRLHDGRRAGARPSAASCAPSRPASKAARSASTSRASSVTCWCATSTARSASSTSRTCSRRSAAASARRNRQCEAQCRRPQQEDTDGAGRDRPPRALRRRQRARRARRPPPRFERKLGKVAIVGSGPSGLAVAADLAQVRLRGDRVRGAARGRRRAAVRHPVVPPAARDHRARGRQPEGRSASSSRPTR